MNVILLHSDHWHVTVTQVAIFMVLSVTSENSIVQIMPYRTYVLRTGTELCARNMYRDTMNLL